MLCTWTDLVKLRFPLQIHLVSFFVFFGRYIRPQFFYNNPLLSFIQFVIGPYTDDLGNVLPYAVEGVGVPVDPLAFAGLLGEFAEFILYIPIHTMFHVS